MLSEIDEYQEELINMTDADRWQWVLENKDLVKINLDNDQTFLTFEGDDRDEPATVTFDEYLGWSDGIQELLTVLGLTALPV